MFDRTPSSLLPASRREASGQTRAELGCRGAVVFNRLSSGRGCRRFQPAFTVLSLPALRQIKAKGVDKKLVGIRIDGDPLPGLNFTKWPVNSDGGKVGKVTSAIYSPRLKANIGFAWVPVGLAGEGSKVDVSSPEGQRSAEVVKIPFVDPSKTIPIG